MQERTHGPVSNLGLDHPYTYFLNFLLVVTGATDGIGREFALQLAKSGFNIFLASRSPEKLNGVATEVGKYLLT